MFFCVFYVWDVAAATGDGRAKMGVIIRGAARMSTERGLGHGLAGRVAGTHCVVYPPGIRRVAAWDDALV